MYIIAEAIPSASSLRVDETNTKIIQQMRSIGSSAAPRNGKNRCHNIAESHFVRVRYFRH